MDKTDKSAVTIAVTMVDCWDHKAAASMVGEGGVTKDESSVDAMAATWWTRWLTSRP